MAAKWIETLVGSLDQKRQYKQQMARIEALPQQYRAAAKALHRYITYQGRQPRYQATAASGGSRILGHR